MLRSPAVNRKQPLLASEELTKSSPTKLPPQNSETEAAAAETPGERRKGKKVGEVAGGTAAECAAVCCCCPCAVVNLLLLAVYKVPIAVCKKAWRRRKRRRVKSSRQGLLTAVSGDGSRTSVSYGSGRLNDLRAEDESAESDEKEGEQNDVVDLEKEMWDKFYGAGFWRSPSQRDTS